MKRKIIELNALKGKLREEKISYRKLSKETNISLNAINSKLNGYTFFTTDEIDKVVEVANIDPNDIVRYFFPNMLRNATDGIQFIE